MSTLESPPDLLYGRWTTGGLVRTWQPEPAFDPRISSLIACRCGALLSEWCGHDERLVSRRCPCGEMPDGVRTYCSTDCSDRAGVEIALRRKAA